ncbi:MAG TPA: BMC domain-containing protein [Acidobacteriota bacterium]|nr:BMC domain-containing protein [Acidobacteriota bacterium]
MERQALGLIETVGLIGAIEAADAAAKSAAVRVVKSEVTSSALVTIHIEGSLGAVQAAVEAGVAACQRIGRVFSFVIIPRPDQGIDPILDAPSNLYRAEPPYCAIVPPPSSGSDTPPPASEKRHPPAPRPRGRAAFGPQDYAAMTVAALRRLARRRGDVAISGRECARADKELLIRLLTEADVRREGRQE